MRAFYCLVCALLLACAGAAPAAARQRWYKGNTHAHTWNSDGDSSPFAVAQWYRSSGYDFVFITDHNILTSVAELNAALGAGGHFLVIPGVEVTDTFQNLPVHLNALNPRELVLPKRGFSVANTLQKDVDAIRAGGGVPYVCHPNWHYAITADDLKALRGNVLFEVHTAAVNNEGNETHPSSEQKWDEVLSAGKVLYGVAADDEHTLSDPHRALPGMAWVVVRAASLTPAEIVGALERGDFYASTGVNLVEYQTSPAGISITTEDVFFCEERWLCPPMPNRVEFIGMDGRVLKTTAENPAVYEFAGDELYVRAKVTNTFGQAAWTQPVFPERRTSAQVVLNAAFPDREAARGRAVAPDTIAVVLGTGFNAVSAQSRRQPNGTFPLELSGTRVTVGGRPVPVFYVSPTQVNFLVPPDAAPGTGEVVITNPQGLQSRLSFTVRGTAPTLFTQDGTGAGEAVAYKLFKELPTIYGGGDGLRRVIVFATGVGRAGVTATANGQPVAVEAVAPSPSLPGLTQIHLALPSGVGAGGAAVTVVIRASGADSNAVTLRL